MALTDYGAEIVLQAMATVRALQDQMLAPLGGTGSARSDALMDALETLLFIDSEEQRTIT